MPAGINYRLKLKDEAPFQPESSTLTTLEAECRLADIGCPEYPKDSLGAKIKPKLVVVNPGSPGTTQPGSEDPLIVNRAHLRVEGVLLNKAKNSKTITKNNDFAFQVTNWINTQIKPSLQYFHIVTGYCKDPTDCKTSEEYFMEVFKVAIEMSESSAAKLELTPYTSKTTNCGDREIAEKLTEINQTVGAIVNL